MTRRLLGMTVFDAAIERMVEVYEQGHRVVISLSGGKDSTCLLEIAVIAADLTGRLPVEAVTRDEEIMFPGTYEYLNRVWHRDDVELTHLVARQPIVNAFDRENPYWWVFDPLVPEDEWVRKPPSYATFTTDLSIESMTTKARFPIAEDAGQDLYSAVGLRVQESRGRLYGIHSAGGHITKPHWRTGVRGIRPIYDWGDGDVWRAIHENSWDFNEAYSVMHRLGIPRKQLRIGPPSMNVGSVELLRTAVQAYPNWWDRVANRLPTLRSAVQYGRRVLEPTRLHGESWESTFHRECIDQAPAWIAERSLKVLRQMDSMHGRHSTAPLPEVSPCHTCAGNTGSWKSLTMNLYGGDPFAIKCHPMLKAVDPEFFRPGSGVWDGAPI